MTIMLLHSSFHDSNPQASAWRARTYVLVQPRVGGDDNW